MIAKDIPDFIFRGAIVAVDGEEKVIRDFLLARPIDRPKEGEVLVLQFKSGEIVEYDPARVHQVHGRAPDFIRVGAEIFWRETRSDMKQYNGVWTIDSYEVGKDPLKGDPHTKVELALSRKVNSTSTYLRRAFNAETMYPVKEDPAPKNLAYMLQKDMKAMKRLKIKPPGKS